jgi:hypothetical protein
MRRSVEGGLISSLLLETDSDDRFSHIELSTAAGLLTLHPEGDGTLHGNIVTDDGIRHITGLPWPPDSVVLLVGSPTAAAAAGRTIAVSGAARVHVLTIYIDLSIEESDTDIEGGGERRRVLDPGVPLLREPASWPLEEGA